MATPKAALRAYRVSRGISAATVAKTLGIAESTLRSYENGSREVDADFALKLERELGINPMLIRPDLFRRHQREPRQAA